MAENNKQFPICVTFSSNWNIPVKEIDWKDGGEQPILSKPQTIVRKALDMQIGFLPRLLTPGSRSKALYVFCQFTGCTLSRFTALVYMKLLNVESKTIMFRCDIEKGFQRTALYPLVNRKYWLNRLDEGFGTELYYEVCVFLSSKIQTMDMYTVEERRVHVRPGGANVKHVILNRGQALEKHLSLDKRILERGAPCLKKVLENESRFPLLTLQGDETEYFKIMLKYMYYKMLPTPNEITEQLLSYALALGMEDFVNMCSTIQCRQLMRSWAPIVADIGKIMVRLDRGYSTEMKLPTTKDFETFFSMYTGVPSKETTFLYGTDSSSRPMVFQPYHGIENVREPSPKRKKVGVSAAAGNVFGSFSVYEESSTAVIPGEPFDYSSHIYGIPLTTSVLPSRPTFDNNTLTGIPDLPCNFEADLEEMDIS